MDDYQAKNKEITEKENKENAIGKIIEILAGSESMTSLHTEGTIIKFLNTMKRQRTDNYRTKIRLRRIFKASHMIKKNLVNIKLFQKGCCKIS